MLAKIAFILLSITAFALADDEDFDGDEDWDQVGGEATQISAKGENLWAINKYYHIMKYSGSGWSVIPGMLTHVGATADGYTWGTNYLIQTHGWDQRHTIFRFNAPGNAWAGIPGIVANINAISVHNAVGVNHHGNIFKWENNAWQVINAEDKNNLFGAMGEGNVIWKIDLNGKLYSFEGGSWQLKETPGVVKSLDVQSSTRVVISDFHNQAWVNFGGKSWYKLPNQHCAQATIGTTNVYCLDGNNRIWKLRVKNKN